MDSLDEWYDSALINGQMWYICVFGGKQCNEVEDSEDLIRQHVRTKHVRQSGDQSIHSTLLTPSPSAASVQSDDSALDPKHVFAEDYTVTESDSTGDESSGEQSSAAKPNRRNRSGDGQAIGRKRVFKCRKNGCDYSTPNRAVLGRHVRDEHRVSDRRRQFRCDRPDCGLSYATRGRLVTHLANHRCGYNMDDMPDQVSHPSDACRRAHINSYAKTKRTADAVKMYECGFDDCAYNTPGISSMRDHIHGQHLCPNRVSLRGVKPRGRSGRRPSAARRKSAFSGEESDGSSETSEDNDEDVNFGQRSSQRIANRSGGQTRGSALKATADGQRIDAVYEAYDGNEDSFDSRHSLDEEVAKL